MPYKFANTVRCNSDYTLHSMSQPSRFSSWRKYKQNTKSSERYFIFHRFIFMYVYYDSHFWRSSYSTTDSMLNLLEAIVAMFVIADVNIEIYIKCVRIFKIYLHTKFHMPSSNNSFVIAIKPKAEAILRTAVALLFHIVQNNHRTISRTFLECLLLYSI
jgi:hypothetical protein